MNSGDVRGGDSFFSLSSLGKFLLHSLFFLIMIWALFIAVSTVLALIRDPSLLFDISQIARLLASTCLFAVSILVQVKITTGKWPYLSKNERPAKIEGEKEIALELFAVLISFLIIGLLGYQYLIVNRFLGILFLLSFGFMVTFIALRYYRIFYRIDPGTYRKLNLILVLIAAAFLIFFLLAAIDPILTLQLLAIFLIGFLILGYYFSKYLDRAIWK